MIRVGEALKTALEKRGLQVIHDRTLHDYPSYTDAYVNSRQAAADYLRQYPSLCLVIDLHRDASSGTNGQLNTQAQAGGKASAQLMLVVGTDANGRPHSNWEKNMTLAVKLHAQLEKQFPGICRPISLRGERFNQDLAPGALLIEVGAAGDTMEEALVAAEALAQGIAALVGL
jgi:stage II sporulation protein P